MTKEYVAEPDLQFTKELIAAGAGDLKKCYQCATCSVACAISPDNQPYPRKEMIWAQWGLRDRLMYDPDVWLCHQCNDCSTMCPRGAAPGDVLKAVRKLITEKYSWPSGLGKLVGSPALFPLTVGIPVVIVLLMVYAAGWRFPEDQEISYMRFVPHLYIQIVFTLALAFGIVSLVIGMRNYWRDLDEHSPVATGERAKAPFASYIEALGEILPHKKFKECTANNARYSAHMLAFYGFLGLMLTTAIVAFNIDVLGHILHIKPFQRPPSMGGPYTIPINILGNAAGIAFIIGLAIMIVRRLNVPDEAGGSSYFDWFFLFVIAGTGVTGFFTEWFRWAGSAGGAYVLYTIHLMFVLALFIYLPFSKFAHLGYRTAAIAWGKSVGRDMTVPTVGKYVPPEPAEEKQEEEAAAI